MIRGTRLLYGSLTERSSRPVAHLSVERPATEPSDAGPLPPGAPGGSARTAPPATTLRPSVRRPGATSRASGSMGSGVGGSSPGPGCTWSGGAGRTASHTTRPSIAPYRRSSSRRRL